MSIATIAPEGFINVVDPMERLFQAKEKKQNVKAQVVVLDYPDNVPTWVLTFPDYPGIKGLVPASETGLNDVKILPRFLGQEIVVKIVGIDRENGLVACSRKAAVAEAAEKLIPKLVKNPDLILNGIVRAVVPPEGDRPSSLLVDIGGGILAVVPKKEARLWLTKPIGVQFPPGSQIRLKITKLEPDGEIFGSTRQTYPDPWKKADFKRGQFVSATVSHINKGIVFVEPDACPGILGIASVPIVGEVNRGDRVTCAVATFDREQKKLRLRLKGKMG